MTHASDWRCATCGPTSLDTHGRCQQCGSDAVAPWDLKTIFPASVSSDPLVERARAWAQAHYLDQPNMSGSQHILAMMAAFARDVVEECCKAVCQRCSSGLRVKPDIYGYWTHYRVINPDATKCGREEIYELMGLCFAAPIRKLFLEARNGL